MTNYGTIQNHVFFVGRVNAWIQGCESGLQPHLSVVSVLEP